MCLHLCYPELFRARKEGTCAADCTAFCLHPCPWKDVYTVRQVPVLRLNAFPNCVRKFTSEQGPKKMLVCGRHPHNLHCACKELQDSAENKAEKENDTLPYFIAEKRKVSINFALIL